MSKFLKITKYGFVIIVLLVITTGFKQNENQPITKVIDKYFNSYLNSFKTLKYEELSEIVEDNENTTMYLSMNRVFIERYKSCGLSYKDYKYKYEVMDLDIREDVANIKVNLNVEYEYNNLPKNVSSQINNIDYKFELKKYNESWRIVGIDTNFDEFSDFKSKVDNYRLSQQRIMKMDAIKEVENQEINKIKNSKLKKNKYDNEIEEKKQEKDEIKFRDFFEDKNKFCDKDLGTRYAREYAIALEDKRIFYTAKDNDCTNFVSQCVWASLGAYDPNDIEKTKKYINNGINMIKGIWLGNSYGVTLAWANVEEFWKLCTTSSAGPKAVGINNNRPYTSINPKEIKVGDVLQIRKKSDIRYKHSVYVTYVAPNNKEYNGIYVSQHTYDKYNRSLVNLIYAWGDDECYIRRLDFHDCIK